MFISMINRNTKHKRHTFLPILLTISLSLVATVFIAPIIKSLINSKLTNRTLSATSIPLQITVYPNQLGTKIPDNFLGLSADYYFVYANKLSKDNTFLVNLLKNLGPGVFRFGGVDANYTYWLKAPDFTQCPVYTSHYYVLSPSNIENLNQFLQATNWKTILGLNLGCYNPNSAAEEALATKNILGNSLLAFEIGNEPNTFVQQGLRKTYSNSDHKNEFLTYLQSIRAKLSDTPVVGPATVFSYSFYDYFLSQESKQILFATNHLYPLDGKSADTTIEKLLSKDLKSSVDAEIKKYADDAKNYNSALRYAEMNNVVGGKTGVSDTFASSLWALDTLFTMAENGVIGVNIHGGFCGGYSPIELGFCTSQDQNKYQYYPMYYGLLMFHLGADGRPAKVQYDTSSNVSVHAVYSDTKILRVIVINKDPNGSVDASINPGISYSQADVIRLNAPSLDAKTGITLGGSSISTINGTWNQVTTEKLNKTNSYFQVTINPASAVLITFTNSPTPAPTTTALPVNCVQKTPTATFVPLNKQSSYPGQGLGYKLTLSNNNSIPCGPVNFTIRSFTTSTDKWDINPSTINTTLNNGGSSSNIIYFTPPKTVQPGKYKVGVDINGLTKEADYNVIDVGKTPSDNPSHNYNVNSTSTSDLDTTQDTTHKNIFMVILSSILSFFQNFKYSILKHY